MVLTYRDGVKIYRNYMIFCEQEFMSWKKWKRIKGIKLKVAILYIYILFWGSIETRLHDFQG